VAEAVNRIDPENDRNMQPRMLDGVPMDDVVFVGPVVPGISDTTVTGGVDAVLGSAGQDRAGVLVDQDLLHARRVRHGETVVSAGGSVCIGQRRDQLLVHLTDLVRQGHRTQQSIHPVCEGPAWVEPGRGALRVRVVRGGP